MTEIEHEQTDVLVLGGGLAGHQAALAAAQTGAKVTLAYRAQGASPFVIAWNVPIAHADERDSVACYAEDMIKGGYELNDRRMVNAVAERSIGVFHDLVKLGIPFEQKDGRYLQRHLSGNRYPRSVYVSVGTGPVMLTRLKQRVAEVGITTLDGWLAVALLQDAAEVTGALLYHPRSGKFVAQSARSVVMAMGGIGRHYDDSTYPVDIGSDSYALAYEAGAHMIDMEFIQFEPVIITDPAKCAGMEMPTAMLGDGAHLLNAQGERFMFRYNPVHGEKQMEKAKLALCVQKEIDEGRGLPDGTVLFDASPLPPEKLESYVIHCRRLRAAGCDPAKDAPHVRPAAHSTMGGIQIDANGWTGVPGFYAAGEAAGGLHGASRLAGNGGSDAIVFGVLAGEGAAKGMLSSAQRDWKLIARRAFENARHGVETRQSGATPDEVKARVRSIVSGSAGLYRKGDALTKASDDLRQLEASIRSGLQIESVRDAIKAREARNMTLTARMIVDGANARTESRGAHQRTDYPDTDEAKWTSHVTFSKGADGELSMSTTEIM